MNDKFIESNHRDCTDSSGPGYYCPNCEANMGKPCRVNPRESDPQTGPMCGTCQSNWCGHSPHYSSSYDKHPSNCGLGIVYRETLWKILIYNNNQLMIVFHKPLQGSVCLLSDAPVLKAGILILAQQVPSAKIMTTRDIPGVTLLMNHLVRRNRLLTRDGG